MDKPIRKGAKGSHQDAYRADGPAWFDAREDTLVREPADGRSVPRVNQEKFVNITRRHASAIVNTVDRKRKTETAGVHERKATFSVGRV